MGRYQTFGTSSDWRNVQQGERGRDLPGPLQAWSLRLCQVWPRTVLQVSRLQLKLSLIKCSLARASSVTGLRGQHSLRPSTRTPWARERTAQEPWKWVAGTAPRAWVTSSWLTVPGVSPGSESSVTPSPSDRPQNLPDQNSKLMFYFPPRHDTDCWNFEAFGWFRRGKYEYVILTLQ